MRGHVFKSVSPRQPWIWAQPVMPGIQRHRRLHPMRSRPRDSSRGRERDTAGVFMGRLLLFDVLAQDVNGRTDGA